MNPARRQSLRASIFRAVKSRSLKLAAGRSSLPTETFDEATGTRQLEAINSAWREARMNIPYYKALQARLLLPGSFRSIGEFREKMPVLTKETLRKNDRLFNRPRRSKTRSVGTSGSTGEPLRIRIWKSEGEINEANSLLGRSWFGVIPGNRIFLFWGDSRGLRPGPSAKAALLTRRLQDRLLNYHRENAYYLDNRSLDGILDRLLRSKPDCLIGYSSALLLIARRLIELNARVPIKAAIATAETFPVPDGARSVAEAFQCPVAMEYGSVEGGVIAHEHPGGGYRVFHDTHFLETLETSPHGSPVAVTKLYPAYIPMFRYRVGDMITGPVETGGSVWRFEKVIGRSDDVIALADGSLIHPESLSHVFREHPAVLQFQLARINGRPGELRVRARQPLRPEERDGIRRKLSRISKALAAVPLVETQKIDKTAAGKSPWLIDE